MLPNQRTQLRNEIGLGGRVAPPAKVFLSRKDAAKAFVHKLLKWWQKRYPHEVRQYEREVTILRETLKNGTGVNKELSIAQMGVLPNRIFSMGEQLIPGFWEDDGWDTWFREFPAFVTRTRKLGHFVGGLS